MSKTHNGYTLTDNDLWFLRCILKGKSNKETIVRKLKTKNNDALRQYYRRICVIFTTGDVITAARKAKQLGII